MKHMSSNEVGGADSLLRASLDDVSVVAVPEARRVWASRVLDLFICHGLWSFTILASAVGYFFLWRAGAEGATLGIVVGLQLALCHPLEHWQPRHPGASAARDPEFWNDIGHNGLGNLVGTPLGEAAFLGSAALVSGWLSERIGGQVWPESWPLVLQIAALVFLADGLEYWRHRAFHGIPWLWAFHALHHSSERLHALKAGRSHVVDMASRALVVFAPLVVLGVPAEVLFWYAAGITIFSGPMTHSDLDMRLPGFVHGWIVTPQVHRIHHARMLSIANANFALVTPVWDRIFRTFQHPASHEDPPVGLEDGAFPERFVDQLLYPFCALRRKPGAGDARTEKGRSARSLPNDSCRAS